jgi:hypothetical protein
MTTIFVTPSEFWEWMCKPAFVRLDKCTGACGPMIAAMRCYVASKFKEAV